MPIQHLLYRCPRCGHDPTTATDKGARCDSCGTSFEQGRASVVLVRSADGEVEEVSVRTLMDAIDELGGVSSRALDHGGRLSYEARVAVAHGNDHQAVWWKGRLLGFFERLTERREATLRLEGDDLTVTSAGWEPLVWPMESILAVQISSKAVQLNIRGVGLYQMEFVSDSPKRWEELLRVALGRFYATRGQEIVEFRPTIVTRPLS